MRSYQCIESARYLWRQTVDPFSPAFFVFIKQRNPIFVCFVQSNQSVFNFRKCELCKRDSSAAQMAPFDRPLRVYSDRERRESRGRCFCKSRSPEIARGREDRVFRLVDDGVPKPCPTIQSERGFPTGVMPPGFDVRMGSPLAEVILRSDLLATGDRVGAERDHLWEKSNRFKMENE